MYFLTIYNDGFPTIIHGERHKVANASVTEAKNEIGTLTFDLYPDNPGWELCRELATTIEVMDTRDGSLAFEGRVIMPVPSMDSGGAAMRSVTCKHVSDYLRDSVQDYVEERQWENPTAFISHVLGVHNARMPEHKRVYAGTVDMQTYETSDGLFCGIQRVKTWDTLQEKLVKAFGGEMRVRRGSDGLLYLDYAEKLGTTHATKIELGVNMLSARREVNPNAVITRLYPYGAKIKETQTDENGQTVEVETENRIGIEDVNGGLPYIEDAVAIEEYGIIEGIQEWDDVTQPGNLLVKSQKWLGVNNGMPSTATLGALDLERIGKALDSYALHDWYPCVNPLIGLDEEREIVRIVKGITDPSQVSIDLGEKVALTSKNMASLGALAGRVETIRSQQQTQITNVGSSVKATRGALTVAEDRIMSEVETSVNVVYELTQTNSTQITQLMQTSDEFSFNFETIEKATTELNGVISTEVEERLKYIKFIDGEIWLGKDAESGEDDFKLRISNQRISFLLNNVEVAYFADDAMYVETAYLYRAYITKGLYIGGVLIEESSDENVNARWVG